MVKDLEMSVVSENSASFLYVIVFTYYCLMGEEKMAGKYLFYSHKIFHMRPASCSLVMICQILLFYHNDSAIVSIFFLLTLSNSVFFIESHVLLFFFFSPLHFPADCCDHATTADSTNWTCCYVLGYGQFWWVCKMSSTYIFLGERGETLFIGSRLWWRLDLLLGCWFCGSNRQSLLNCNLFFDETFFFLFHCWQRWRN